jgi:hypothetical protein
MAVTQYDFEPDVWDNECVKEYEDTLELPVLGEDGDVVASEPFKTELRLVDDDVYNANGVFAGKVPVQV